MKSRASPPASEFQVSMASCTFDDRRLRAVLPGGQADCAAARARPSRAPTQASPGRHQDFAGRARNQWCRGTKAHQAGRYLAAS